MEFKAYCTDDLSSISTEIIDAVKDYRLFAFYGKMGVGKTTLILHLLKAIGVNEGGNSPTYSLVNEYHDSQGNPVYHFDFYRIENIEEVYDIGYEEYMYSGAYCFIEWPEKIEELLPDDVVKFHITEEENFRKIAIELP
jgi:tRNA threonylcarbamoyladenosine biosynthesis protein TsaE